MIDIDTTRSLLRDRRWFGGDADAAQLAFERRLATDPPLTQVLVAVDAETYQLIVTDEAMDATEDHDAALALLSVVAPDESCTTVRPLGVEQSNTSLVYDERLLLKLFRRVTNDPHPDAEVPAALRDAGFDHVPQLLARWNDAGRDLAVVVPFLPGASDGWALALVSLRQLFTEGCDPAEAGGDFAQEAERLGEITADMHAAMARAFGTTAADLDAWADMLADGRKASELRGLQDAGVCIRVHGDLHLGQLLRADDGWYVVDFEGEPARPEGERGQHSSALKDVAGMLRSFDYAAAVAVREQMADNEDAPDLARRWERRNRAAFLEGYRRSSKDSELLPSNGEATQLLLDAFELDKALYEVA